MKRVWSILLLVGLSISSLSTLAMDRGVKLIVAHKFGIPHNPRLSEIFPAMVKPIISPPRYNAEELTRYKHSKEELITEVSKAGPDHRLVERIINRPLWGSGGPSPLQRAAGFDDISFMKFLLQKGAAQEINQHREGAPSSLAIFEVVSAEAEQILQEYGADFNQYNKGQGKTAGMNPLHRAAYRNDIAMFLRMISKGLNPADLTEDGDNLFLCLVAHCLSSCPDESIFDFARILHRLHIYPSQKNLKGLNAISFLDYMIKNIEYNLDDKDFINIEVTLPSGEVSDTKSEVKKKLYMLNKLRQMM